MIQDITLIDKIQMKDIEECKQIEEEDNSRVTIIENIQTGETIS